ncbi:Cof subfamily protein (haloacid dehalogenase superfamily) [Chryseobacterium sp. H1D6B]|uniref:Cof-type HAD-IIB family hydrolase n=1 Tax=Chryseobacterium sp. H1D6B TaxID=2940588 RepID=UPI0015CD2ED6|nr:Cof-type HAD-IIB family hydrolase [Chryseobacterium sp. H1D6B]MDH6252441.1 Cof subfamily protein (haloacid dehalogenase superfamily) [Chryseobacterium sp. H1D6B]
MTSVQNPKIKAVFFDVDGTIFSLKTKSIPESTRKAIKNLRKKGIKVIVATGRSITDLAHIKHIEFDGFMTFNGGYCMTVDGQVMYRKVIEPDDIKNLIDYSKRSDVSFSLMYEDKVRISNESPKVLELYRHVDIPVPPLCNKEDIDVENVLQVNVFIDPENEESFMREIMPNSLSSRWTPLFADVNPEGVSKQGGVEYFCKYFNIDLSETMAFGDGGNDISMLKSVKIGVAMGNAGDNVKEIADFITEEVDHHGIEKALIHFGLLEKTSADLVG